MVASGPGLDRRGNDPKALKKRWQKGMKKAASRRRRLFENDVGAVFTTSGSASG